ncbi:MULTISPECIES: Na+/H+ antiporter NhaA [Microbacterium]|uniref:Na(+)/H(+) antiporter NhaA n=1 Tax=Microbacterium laevaniformans TaxID=36807 RepID=A0A150HE70_9MICO|nr:MULTISPECIES: Na+/H+ antiporter NhaA [Microbacterium]KXZ60417.1 Na(+)/H(+) antiporter NhaA [Microbacterium laevaniformans]ODT24074.1 MAG: sodium:proton antiporter [Microbacterium sp. SCN 69-37]
MSLLRSARFPAVLLLVAASIGLVLANSAAAPIAFAVADDAHIGIPGVIDLSVRHWISDGLLAVFFFVAAVELQFELTSGQLASPRRAVLPAIAAAGGVIVPVVLYVLIAGGEATSAGWPIPTATDIAFALGVLAVFGRGLPSGVRIFLLALAILDDIVGIVFIAVLFTADVDFAMMLLALVFVVVFAACSRLLDTRARPVAVVGLVASAIGTWYAVHESGVHATIAGVVLGLAMAQQPALRARHALEPWVNAIVLPLFALCAALVAIPAVSAGELSPAFWGVLVALPVGKIIGIAVAGALAQHLLRVPKTDRLAGGDLLAAGALGGIGFTVSLLLSELAFSGAPDIRDQATLGVLAGSALSLVIAGILVSWRAWHHRRRSTATV